MPYLKYDMLDILPQWLLRVLKDLATGYASSKEIHAKAVTP
jgi:hypothetical protein